MCFSDGQQRLGTPLSSSWVRSRTDIVRELLGVPRQRPGRRLAQQQLGEPRPTVAAELQHQRRLSASTSRSSELHASGEASGTGVCSTYTIVAAAISGELEELKAKAIDAPQAAATSRRRIGRQEG